MPKQKIFFKQAYDLGDDRVPSGYGWPMEADPQVQSFLDLIKGSVNIGNGLDIGCGQGRHTFLLADNGFESYGIDFLDRPINEAKAEAKSQSNKDVHFEVMDVLDLTFEQNFFDVIIDWSVLDHIYPDDWPKYLENINKVLKSSGYLILIEFSSKDKRITDQDKNFNDDKNYDHFFKQDEIESLFGKHFEIIKVIYNELNTTSHFSMINILLKKK